MVEGKKRPGSIRTYTKEEFLDLIIYEPGEHPGDQGWRDLKKAMGKVNRYETTVKEVAEFLIKNPDFWQENETALCVHKIESNFQRDKMDDITTSRLNEKQDFLEDGNRRSIAYAIRILKGKEKYIPVETNFLDI